MARIVKVETGRFDYAVAGTFKFFKAQEDGVVRRPSVLVRLTDEDGGTGCGQAVPVPSWTYETVETVLSTLNHHLAPELIGLEVDDIPGLHALMQRVIRPAFSVGQPLCKAAVDLACHDLTGRRRGIGVGQLLGGQRRGEVLLSWTVASPVRAVVEEQIVEGLARGYRNFNIKVGSPQDGDYDVELARRVREIAPNGFLWADANTGYTVEEALVMARRLADAGVDVLESPLPPNQIRGYQALKKVGALPVLMDEGILSPVEAAEFADLGMMDGIALKPARNAGLFPSRAIVEAMRERGLMILGSGLTDPDLSLAAAAHLYDWAGITHPCALNGPQFLTQTACVTGLEVREDRLTVPAGPGLGLEISEEASGCLKTVAGG
ncbi:MAG: enolase C-terminal domain-like protein [Opitutaceae bacterium]